MMKEKIINLVKDNYQIVILFAIGFIIFTLGYVDSCNRENRKKYACTHKIVVGKCAKKRPCLIYSFYVKNNEYTIHYSIFGDKCCLSSECLEKQYVVEYDSLDPMNCELKGFPCESRW